MFRIIIKTLLWISILFFGLIGYILFSGISSDPIVVNGHASPVQVKNAKRNFDYVREGVFGPKQVVRLVFTQRNVKDISAAASHLFARADFDGQFSKDSGVLKGSLNLKNQFFSGYVNVSCYLVAGSKKESLQDKRTIENCRIGDIPVSGRLVHDAIDFALSAFFDNEVHQTINQLVDNIRITDERVILKANKSADFKQSIKSGLQSVASTVKTFKQEDAQDYDPKVINEYLTYLSEAEWPKGKTRVSLSFVVSKAFELAKERSKDGDAREENANAVWAIAIGFANSNFAEFIKVDTPEVRKTIKTLPKVSVRIKNRKDLQLHFLYSAVMSSLGNSALSVQVGELKELYDANPKGSGFDFTDLAADKSGARFARFLSGSASDAEYGQEVLAGNPDESLFFPDISGLPKPVRGKDFDSAIGSTETERYKELVELIEQRIDNLPLYQ